MVGGRALSVQRTDDSWGIAADRTDRACPDDEFARGLLGLVGWARRSVVDRRVVRWHADVEQKLLHLRLQPQRLPHFRRYASTIGVPCECRSGWQFDRVDRLGFDVRWRCATRHKR